MIFLMNRSVITFVLLVAVFIALPVSAQNESNGSAVLQEISFEQIAYNQERVFLRLENGTNPKIFTIKGEKPRLVADLINTKPASGVRNKIVTEGYLVKSIRVGQHNDPPKTRVVLDLGADIEFSFAAEPDEQGVVISLTHDAQPKTAPPVTEAKTDSEEAVVEQSLQSEQERVQETELPPQTAVPESKPDDAEKTSEIPEDRATERVSEPATQEHDERSKQQASSAAVEERVEQIIADIKEEKPSVADPVLLDITFESTANDSEMVLFKLNDFYPPLVFGIEKGNPRVVCDFLDTVLGSDIETTIQTRGMFVSRIRTALHPSPAKVRVVLDLVPNKNYDLQQVFFKEDNLFVIIISEFEKDNLTPLKTIPEADPDRRQ